MAEPQWFYVRNGERHGPLTLDALVRMIATGILSRDTLVWRDGGPEAWAPAHAVEELASHIPPPLPGSRSPDGTQGVTQDSVEPRWHKATWQTPNRYATAGLWLALVSIFCFTIGILPILAVVFSSVGLAKARSYGGWGKGRAQIGLVIGLIYTLMYLRHYGHLG